MSAAAGDDLVIFDCDGVLVDSEVLSNRVTAELLCAAGYPITAEACIARFVGMRIASLVAEVEAEWGRRLPDDFAARIHAGADRLFDAELQAIAGVAEALAAVTGPKCVASSGRPQRIRRSLATVGLIHHFPDEALFSAAMVARGKPAPDLFLHAAAAMGVDPARAVVVEDSLRGVQAGVAAGMRVLGFCGGAHIRPGDAEALLAAGAACVFADMADLPGLLCPAGGRGQAR